MQTCSKCHTQTFDIAVKCPNCGADLYEYSTTAVSLKRMQENTRVRDIRLVVAHNCCPACMEVEGTYEKNSVPRLPVEGCSHQYGCRCFYEPMLNEIYP